jgi:hypothetical protein
LCISGIGVNQRLQTIYFFNFGHWSLACFRFHGSCLIQLLIYWLVGRGNLEGLVVLKFGNKFPYVLCGIFAERGTCRIFGVVNYHELEVSVLAFSL